MLIKYNNHLTFTSILNIKNLDSRVSFVYVKHNNIFDIYDDNNKITPILCCHVSNKKFHLISFFSNNKKYEIDFKIISTSEHDKFHLIFEDDKHYFIFIDVDKYVKFYNYIIRKFVNYNTLGRSERKNP